MTNRLSIDVVLATYDGARYLDELLASLAQQTKVADRLIVIDDGSTDATVEIVQNFAESAPFEVVVVANEANSGSAAAFARGISLATADCVALCDQDDVWRPEKLAHLLAQFDDSVVLAASDAALIDHAGQRLAGSLWHSVGFTPPPIDAPTQRSFVALSSSGSIAGMTMLMRTRVAQACLPVGEGWHHDGWLAAQAPLHGRVVLLTECLVDYRIHGDQQTTPGEAERLSSQERATRFAAGAERARLLAAELERYDQAPWAARHVADKASFLQRRADAAERGVTRVAPVLAAIRSGQYGTFASWRSVIGDLLGVSAPHTYVG